MLYRFKNNIPAWNDALINDPRVYKYEQSAQFFNYSMPTLQNLALQGILMPTGGIDVTTGKITLTLEFKPVTPFPDWLPSSMGSYDFNQTNGDTNGANLFHITWTLICNGISKSCSSDEPCDIIMDCSDPINALNGWSSRWVDIPVFIL